MKKFVVRCLVNEGPHKGTLLGYVACDNASGGYPYSTDSIEFIAQSYAEGYMGWVATKLDLLDYTDGSQNFPLDTAIFCEKYRKLLNAPPKQANRMAMCFELIEVDVTDILFVESKICQIIEVDGRTSASWTGRAQAFYKIVSNQKF